MIATKKFYNRYTPEVAKDLLGCFLMRQHQGKIYKGIITETEAYRGLHDRGCHAWCGKTKRNTVMFGPAGYNYVYLIYGTYWMLNFVTEKEGYPAAVLVRGIDLIDDNNKVIQKLDGPGKLTKGLFISENDNGKIINKKEKLWVEIPRKRKVQRIIVSPRVGIDYAGHCKEWKWNFRLVN